MAKLLARVQLEYDSHDRIGKLRLLSKVLSEHKGCIIKIVEPSTVGDDNVFYIRPGKHIINHDACTHWAEMIINSDGMLSICDPETLPDVNRWKKYVVEWAGRYVITVYDKLPDDEVKRAERRYKEEMAILERMLKRVRRDYVRAMRITQNVDWLGNPEMVFNYKPV